MTPSEAERGIGAAGERIQIVAWLRQWALNVGFPNGAVLHYVAHRIDNLEYRTAIAIEAEGGDGEAGSAHESAGQRHRQDTVIPTKAAEEK